MLPFLFQQALFLLRYPVLDTFDQSRAEPFAKPGQERKDQDDGNLLTSGGRLADLIKVINFVQFIKRDRQHPGRVAPAGR